MNNYIDGILVVEGNNDASLISSFIECEIVITQGFELNKKTIDYLKEQSKYKQIIVLTDPDEAGESIRDKLNELIPDLINVEVDKNKCNKNNKHGVAECEKEEIINALKPYFSQKANIFNEISINNLFELNLIGDHSKERRDMVIAHFKLGNCNGKKLLQRLNSRNIKLKELKEVLGE